MPDPLTMTDVATAVERIFGDSANILITFEDIVRWANEAQLEIVRNTDILQKTQDFLGHTAETVALDENHLAVVRATWDGRRLDETTLEDLDRDDPDRDSSSNTGTPRMYYLWGQDIYLYPVPSDAGDLRIYYIKSPVELSLGADVLEIPPQFHNEVIRYCLAQAKKLDDDLQSAIIMEQDFRTRVGAAQSEYHDRTRDSYPAVRVLEGDLGYWDG